MALSPGTAETARPPGPPSPAARAWTRRWRGLRRAVLARRRLLAAAFAGLAVLAALRAVAAPPPDTVPVLVAGHDLAAGSSISADDVERVAWPAGTAPDGSVEEPVGRVLAAPLRAGEPVTDVRLVGPGLAEAAPGLTALPVRLPDAGVAALLRAGDRIDLLATDPGDGRTEALAHDVLVLAVPPAGSEMAAEAGSVARPAGRLVVLAVTPAEVAEVTGAALSLYLSVAFSR